LFAFHFRLYSKTLITLNLAANMIEDTGVGYLAEALRINKVLLI